MSGAAPKRYSWRESLMARKSLKIYSSAMFQSWSQMAVFILSPRSGRLQQRRSSLVLVRSSKKWICVAAKST